MRTKRYEFLLSRPEWQVLQDIVHSAGQKIAPADVRIGQSEEKVTVLLEPANIEKLRDLLTLELARSGFDEDYSHNERGRTLEDLIDRLFVP